MYVLFLFLLGRVCKEEGKLEDIGAVSDIRMGCFRPIIALF